MNELPIISLPFVVLRHDGVDEPHFDFLFDNEGVGEHRGLIAFRVPNWPIVSRVEVQKLRNHRVAYLTYEGPISGDRGSVLRVDEGRLEWRQAQDGFVVRFHPPHRGGLLLRPSGESWIAEAISA